MKMSHILLALRLTVVLALGRDCRASEITDLKVFSEKDYVRIAVALDGQSVTQVETNAADQLVFVRFADAGIGSLGQQSFLYPESSHLESITFLPLEQGSTVARVKVRHPFRARTFETQNPRRFILELSQPEPPAAGAVPSAVHPENSYFNRGLSQMQKGSYEPALMAFRSAIRAGERTADSYYMAGMIRVRLGQDDKALTNFMRARESQSYGDDARLYLSWLHYKNSDLPAMLRSFRDFEARLPEPEKRLALATGHPEIDYRALEAAVNQRENKPSVKSVGLAPLPVETPAQVTDSAAYFFGKAMDAKEQGRLEEAAGLLDKTLFFDKNNSQACFQLGTIYKELGRDQLSVKFFEKSLGADKRNGGPAELIEGEPAPDEEARVIPDSATEISQTATAAPVTADAAAAEPVNAQTPAAGAQTPAAGAQTQAAPEPERAEGTEAQTVSAEPVDNRTGSRLLAAFRKTAAGFISLPNVELLRRQVKILSLVLGLIFLLTMVGERVVVRKKRAYNSPFSQVVKEFRQAPASGNTAGQAFRAPAEGRESKRQVEAVLARELATKKRARAEGEVRVGAESAEFSLTGGESLSGLALHLRPVGERGMYGADIARRIKDELSGDKQTAGGATPPGPFSLKRRDDLQSRLIRQLRNKNWTISDIAQEMNLSREEVKWALASSSSPRNDSLDNDREADSTREAGIGQARGLLGRRKKASAEFSGTRKIDKEVDLELEINV